MAQSRDDIITMNIVSLVQAKKNYDAAKLNFKYQQNQEDSAAVSVPLLLARLKEDTQEMLKENSDKGRRLLKLTVQRLANAMININKISENVQERNLRTHKKEIYFLNEKGNLIKENQS